VLRVPKVRNCRYGVVLVYFRFGRPIHASYRPPAREDGRESTPIDEVSRLAGFMPATEYMQTDNGSPQSTKIMYWAGWVISAIPILMFTASAVLKFMKTDEAMKGFHDLGWPDSLALALGITELTCTVIYAIPRTSVLGAILLTGYMGGAIATHVRIGELFVVQALLGVAVWLGLYLRESRIRALIPLRS
jgi:DoxX-like family